VPDNDFGKSAQLRFVFDIATAEAPPVIRQKRIVLGVAAIRAASVRVEEFLERGMKIGECRRIRSERLSAERASFVRDCSQSQSERCELVTGLGDRGVIKCPQHRTQCGDRHGWSIARFG